MGREGVPKKGAADVDFACVTRCFARVTGAVAQAKLYVTHTKLLRQRSKNNPGGAGTPGDPRRRALEILPGTQRS